jgi:hypothetical protein
MLDRRSRESYDGPMKKPTLLGAFSVFAAFLCVSVTTFHFAEAQAPAVEPLHFHHVHLDSVDPKAAAEYYPRPFAFSATKTTYNGFEAVKTGKIYLLFSKVETTPQNELICIRWFAKRKRMAT